MPKANLQEVTEPKARKPRGPIVRIDPASVTVSEVAYDVPLPSRSAASVIDFAKLDRPGATILIGGLPIGHVRSAARKHADEHGGEYVAREVDGGVRVWRKE